MAETIPNDIFNLLDSTDLEIAKAQESIALEKLRIMLELKKSEPINVDALRAANLQMVFREDGSVVYQRRQG